MPVPASNFTAQEITLFEKTIASFDDGLVIGRAAEVFDPLAAEQMARSGDRFWLPQPQIASTFDGFDQTSNFHGLTELQVPVTIGYHKVDPIQISSKDLRFESAVRNRMEASKRKLQSDINFALFQTAALYGSVFVRRSGSPTGFDDIAEADAAMTEIGVPLMDRKMVLAPRVANAMAGNLASRNEDSVRSRSAYERALIRSDVAGFETFKNDTSYNLPAAAGGSTTVNGANQRRVPAASVVNPDGSRSNVDNRYTDLVVTAANYAGIAVGDAFTIAGVNKVHLITKQDTGQLQTFRVVGKPAANTIRVYPAIIDAPSWASGGAEYKNVTAAPATGAAITWLNTVTAPVSPFFVRENLLLIPGSYAVDPEDGWQVMQGETELGIKLTYTRQGDINNLSVKARWEVDFGTALLQPQMAGAMVFNQV